MQLLNDIALREIFQYLNVFFKCMFILSLREPNVGLDPTDCEIVTSVKSRVRRLAPPGTPFVCFLNLKALLKQK